MCQEEWKNLETTGGKRALERNDVAHWQLNIVEITTIYTRGKTEMK